MNYLVLRSVENDVESINRSGWNRRLAGNFPTVASYLTLFRDAQADGCGQHCWNFADPFDTPQVICCVKVDDNGFVRLMANYCIPQTIDQLVETLEQIDPDRPCYVDASHSPFDPGSFEEEPWLDEEVIDEIIGYWLHFM